MAVIFLEVAFVGRFVVSVNGDGLLFPEPIMRLVFIVYRHNVLKNSEITKPSIYQTFLRI